MTSMPPATPATPMTTRPMTSRPMTSPAPPAPMTTRPMTSPAPMTSRPPTAAADPKKNVLKPVADFLLASKQDRVLGGACHDRPWGCLQQLVIGTLAVAGAWTLIAWYVDHKPPNVINLLKFCSIFLPVSFVLRWLDVEIQDKLSIAAGMTLGNKMVQVLTM